MAASDLTLRDLLGVISEGMDATKLAKGSGTEIPDHLTRLSGCWEPMTLSASSGSSQSVADSRTLKTICPRVASSSLLLSLPLPTHTLHLPSRVCPAQGHFAFKVTALSMREIKW